jgi:hypothetical protein
LVPDPIGALITLPCAGDGVLALSAITMSMLLSGDAVISVQSVQRA